jgi:hypothetical protein
MSKRLQSDGEMLKGTPDMMILRSLVTGNAHGHTIAKVIERTSKDVLEVEANSRVPGGRPLGSYPKTGVVSGLATDPAGTRLDCC